MLLNNSNNPLQVNGLSIENVRKRVGKVTYRNSFITNLELNCDNVEQLAVCGTARLKIENESFNLLKNNVYHLRHNFEHEHQGLSNLLLTLNLLAFTFSTTCDQLCQLWHTTRTTFSRRHRLFVILDIIKFFNFFQNWQELLTAITNPPLHPDLPTSAHLCATPDTEFHTDINRCIFQSQFHY